MFDGTVDDTTFDETCDGNRDPRPDGIFDAMLKRMLNGAFRRRLDALVKSQTIGAGGSKCMMLKQTKRGKLQFSFR